MPLKRIPADSSRRFNLHAAAMFPEIMTYRVSKVRKYLFGYVTDSISVTDEMKRLTLKYPGGYETTEETMPVGLSKLAELEINDYM